MLLGFLMMHLASGGDLIGCNYRKEQQPQSRPNEIWSVSPNSVNQQLSCRDERSQRDNDCQSWRQAEAGERQACIAYAQFVVASALGLFGLIGLFYTVRYTADSARAASQAVIAGQRAWIKRNNIKFAIPLEFRNDGLVNSGVRMEFLNMGNAPALHVQVGAKLLAVTDGKVPESRAQKYFDERRAREVSGGFTLFPNEAYPKPGLIESNYGITLSRDEVDAAVDEYGRMVLYIAACISYSFATDPQRYHQTSCLFEVTAISGFLERSRGAIIETDLRLLQFGFMGMDVAD